ncbi:hypothetical protein TRICI_004305 [Trichomonascus ciferrii]|uniref:Uncharacterized protein n=1 Tax=Trichomonascus ciferrii TaxID=44093 RepID=A0A642V1F4_9ASCO|nr:hypothetical protein TRICI_004305 [Trichomonascus ciferrii]
MQDVWETTQENLENAVGSAYSGWNRAWDSFDIFFDMYDDDDAFGRDELERLLNEDNDNDGHDHVVNDNDNPDDQFPGNEAYGRIKSMLLSVFPSLHRYKPSTNDLIGVTGRTRSSTKSSTQSSETYRSRRDLFSDDDEDFGQQDAHMVSEADITSKVMSP